MVLSISGWGVVATVLTLGVAWVEVGGIDNGEVCVAMFITNVLSISGWGAFRAA